MTKVQPSSIDRLPDDIREQLQALLRDPRVTQLEATRRINEIIEQDGRAEPLSYSAVNRYTVKMRKIGARIQQSREISKMWIGTLGATPQGEVGKLLNEVVRNLAFDAAVGMADSENPIEPKILKDLAIAIERLERAASENVKREKEIRKQALEEAADSVGKTAKQAGVSEDTIRIIRRDVLRMAE